MAQPFNAPFRDLAVRMQRKLTSIEEAMPQAVHRAADTVATRARDNTPVQTGNLRGTVRVVDEGSRDGETSALVVAGGPSAPYAVAVHERPIAEDRPGAQETPEGHQGARFISRAAMFNHGALRDEVAGVVRGALNSKG